MRKVLRKNLIRERRKIRVSKKINGTSAMPRISVYRSNKYLQVQLIDDVSEKTLIGATTKSFKGKKIDQSIELGKVIAEKALKAGIKSAVLDRNKYRYHGRIKAFVESLRSNGIKI